MKAQSTTAYPGTTTKDLITTHDGDRILGLKPSITGGWIGIIQGDSREFTMTWNYDMKAGAGKRGMNVHKESLPAKVKAYHAKRRDEMKRLEAQFSRLFKNSK